MTPLNRKKIYALGTLTLVIPLILAILTLSSPPTSADEVYTFVVKKQEEKAKNRWYFLDWLEAKEKIRIMDMWLALHTPSPYEFFLKGSWNPGTDSGAGRYSGNRIGFGAYATIFGLEVERQQKLEDRITALVHLRLFGYHYQGSHLRLEGGFQQITRKNQCEFRNALAGIGMNAYITKKVGVSGLYRRTFGTTPNALTQSISNTRYEAGAFLDFQFIRAYGNYVWEDWSIDPTTLKPDSRRSGPEAGLQIFF